MVSGGSLPGRLAATKPQPASTATAAPSQKPRASAPSTRSARRSRVHSASCPTACCSASASSSSGEMSLKPTPSSGKSGTSRTRVLRSIPATRARLLHQVPHVTPQQQVRQLLRALCEPLQVTERGLPAFGAPRTQGRPDHRFEQAALAVGCRAKGAQVSRSDSEARERLARSRDVRLALGVDPLSALHARREQSELLELAGAPGGDAGAVAKLC